MIRVLIVEEVRAMGEVIATVLQGEADIEVVGCATTLDETMAELGNCDVVLVNAALRGDSCPTLIRAIRRVAPGVKVVAMGLARSQQAILQCVEAGAAGYVFKDDALHDVLKCLRAAFNNEALVSPPMAATLMSYIAELAGFEPAAQSPESCVRQTLTRREREVLVLLQQGLTNQEIAESLVIELGTVKNHVHNILRKLNVNSRRDVAYLSRLPGFWSSQGAPRPPAPVKVAERPVYAAPVRALTG